MTQPTPPAIEAALDDIDRNVSASIYWLTAELPIPEPTTVEATVEGETL